MGGGRGGRFGGGRGMGGGRGGFGGGRGPGRAHGWETVDRSKQACVFFAQGKCTKGDACPFSHVTPEAGVSQIPVVSQPPQRTGIPEGRLPQGTARAPLATGPAARNGNMLEADTGTPQGVNRGKKSTTGFPGQSSPHAGTPPASRNGRQGSQNDDAFVSDAHTTSVVGGAEKTNPNGPNDQPARAAAPLNPRKNAPGHTGIIALPDGGFVTRKRAAELQLGKDERPETNPRQVRQREVSQPQERRPSVSGNRSVPSGPRVSIMDRLGPAKQASETISTRGNVTARPVRVRAEAQARTRAEARPRITPTERPIAQTLLPPSLSKSRGLASARPMRHTEGGRSSGVHTSTVGRPPAPAQRKSPTLDFKITTLGEIKSRKAKAEGAAAQEPATRADARPERTIERVNGPSASKADTVASGSVGRASSQEEKPQPAQVQTHAPAPTTAGHEAPQLDAEDMDEFSEWL